MCKKCEHCGKPFTMLPYKCNYCGKTLCSECAFPEKHNCEGLK